MLEQKGGTHSLLGGQIFLCIREAINMKNVKEPNHEIH